MWVWSRAGVMGAICDAPQAAVSAGLQQRYHSRMNPHFAGSNSPARCPFAQPRRLLDIVSGLQPSGGTSVGSTLTQNCLCSAPNTCTVQVSAHAIPVLDTRAVHPDVWDCQLRHRALSPCSRLVATHQLYGCFVPWCSRSSSEQRVLQEIPQSS